MPSAAFQLIDKTMLEVSSASGAGKISFGLLAALWASARGVGAMMQSLNSAYDSTESRSWWKQRLVALILTVALSVLIIGAVIVIFGGSRIAEHLGTRYGFSDAFVLTWKIMQWPIALAFMLLAFALIYYFAPDVPNKWEWITPGSVIGVLLWLLVSFAFKGYLHFFDSYSKTYGSLGAVIVLMLWLYLTGAAVLVGGEINAEIENAAAERGSPAARRRRNKTAAS
jgi:membrane protein